MLKMFCDICNKDITGEPYRILSMSNKDGSITYINGRLASANKTIPEQSICDDCAEKLVVHLEILKNRYRRS